jgi:hypothetical protein
MNYKNIIIGIVVGIVIAFILGLFISTFAVPIAAVATGQLSKTTKRNATLAGAFVGVVMLLYLFISSANFNGNPVIFVVLWEIGTGAVGGFLGQHLSKKESSTPKPSK